MRPTAVDRRSFVANEAMALISSMRKSSRWLHSSMAAILGTDPDAEDGVVQPLTSRLGLRQPSRSQHKGHSDVHLITELSHLCTELLRTPDFDTLSAYGVLKPFLEVIKAPTTTGQLTLIALVTVDKVLALGALSAQSPDIGKAMYETAFAVTHCRFEASDQTESESVLHQLLLVMQRLVTSNLGPLLSDDALLEIMETGLSMANRMRRGEILRRQAAACLTNIVRTVVQQLPLEPDATEEAGLDEEPVLDVDHLTQGANGEPNGEPNSEANGQASSEAEVPGAEVQLEAQADAETGVKLDAEVSVAPQQDPAEAPDSAPSYSPYGVPAIRRVFRVLVSLLDTESSPTADNTRGLALHLLIASFEAAGPVIARHPSFVSFISEQLFKSLAQIVRRNNPMLVREALRLFALIIETDKEHYKLQIELILVYLLTNLTPLTDLPRDVNIDKMFYDGVPSRPKFVKPPHESFNSGSKDGQESGRGTPVSLASRTKTPEVREIMIEAIASIAHSPGFFPTLFINYDCDVQQTDLCEDLVGFLCRNAYPDSATWSTGSVPPLCLESVLTFVQSLISRLPSNSQASQGKDKDEDLSEASVEKIMATKGRKAVETSVADAFNDNPKRGIAAAVSNDVIPDDSPESIGRFLHSSRRLNKTVLGRYLTKKGNTAIMTSFINQFDLGNNRIDEALRAILTSFRLPGESGEIEPFLERFTEQYLKGAHDTVIKDVDSGFVLCYSIVMLNTDQHSRQVKNRMPFESFKSNLRGVNAGQDFPEDFLRDIYLNIKNREIVLPEEHDNDESFEFAWKDLLGQLSQVSDRVAAAPPAIDSHVFEVSWRPIVSTLSFIFATATDDLVFSRVITGFQHVAALASHYQTKGAIDHIIESLSKISTLASGDLSAPSENIEIKIKGIMEGEREHSVIVSDLSVPFGSDLKAQMASVTLVRILKSPAAANLTSVGWELVARSLANLYLYDLANALPHTEKVRPFYTFERSKAGKNVGIFSALSSYLTSSNEVPPEPSDEDVDAALGAQECILACDVPGLLDYIKHIGGTEIVSGVISAIPSLSDGDKYQAAIFYLLELVLFVAGTDETAVSHALDSLVSLGESIAQANPAVQGRTVSFLLRAASLSPKHTSKALDLAHEKPAGSRYFVPQLLKFDGSNWQVWSVLSQLELPAPRSSRKADAAAGSSSGSAPTSRNSKRTTTKEIKTEDLHPLTIKVHDWVVANIKRAPQQSLKEVLSTITRVVDAGDISALDGMYDVSDRFETRAEFEVFLQAAIQPCLSADARVRERALDKLQKLVQTQDLAAKHGMPWEELLTVCLIPLMEELLKQAVYKRDPKGMDMTRQRAASILCKTFLQYAVVDDSGIEDVWKQILHVLDRLLSSRRQPALTESISEMLKNVILVLRLSYKGNTEFWQTTVRTLRGFLPELADLVKQENERSARASTETERADAVAEANAAVESAASGPKEGTPETVPASAPSESTNAESKGTTGPTEQRTEPTEKERSEKTAVEA